MNLATIWHLYRADFLRLRWLIILTWVFLLSEAAQFSWSDPWSIPSDGSSNSDVPEIYREWNRLYLPFFAILASVLASVLGWSGVSMSVLRPVRRREMVAAKFLSLTTWIILPQLSAMLWVLHANGIPWAAAFRSVLLASCTVIPFWFILAAFGRLAGSFCRMTALVGAGLGLFSLLSVFLPESARGIEHLLYAGAQNAWASDSSPLMRCFLGASAVGLLLLVLFTARRWSALWRCGTGMAFLILIAISLQGRGLFSLADFGDPADRLSANELAAVQPITPTLAHGRTFKMRNQHNFTVSAAVGTSGLPPGVACLWLRDGKASFSGNQLSNITDLPWNTVKNRYEERQLLAGQENVSSALAEALPQGTSFQRDLLQWDMGQDPVALVNFGTTITSSAIESVRTGVALSAEVSGVLFRYETIVNVPLSDTALALDAGRLNIRTIPGRLKCFPFVDLSLQYPSATSEAEMAAGSTGLMDTWRVFLYFPRIGDVYLSNNQPLSRYGRLLGGGATHRKILQFGMGVMPRTYTAADVAEARLLILRPKILGVVKREVRTGAIPLEVDTRYPGQESSDFYYTLRQMAPKDFFDQMGRTRPDPASATDEEFGRWMLSILGNHTMDDWLPAEFARWIPKHLDMMLRPKHESAGQRGLQRALTDSLPESRKSEIIRRVENTPWLINVLAARGWLEEARQPLLRLLGSGRTLEVEQLRYIARLQAPEAQDQLLAAMERTGDMHLYEMLRVQQGIEPRLTEAVKRYFARYDWHGKLPEGAATYDDGGYVTALALPLRHGIPAAKDQALALFRWCYERRPMVGDSIAPYFALPAGMRNDSKEAAEFIKRLKPEGCQWDPITRRWISQAN